MARAIGDGAGLSRCIEYGVYRLRAGLGPGHLPIDVLAMARRILGPDAVCLDNSIIGETFLRPCTGGGFQLLVKSGPDLRFRIVTALAQHVLNTDFPDNVFGSNMTERIATRIAAAVLAPDNEVRRICPRPRPENGTVGPYVPRLAERFGVSTGCMFLRLGEVFRDERALICSTGKVLVRSAGRVNWDEIPVLDVAAGRPWPGLHCTHLKGPDDGRIAVRAIA